MRRIAGLLVVAALGVAAAAQIAPGPADIPEFTGLVAPEPSAIARSSVWYCAWADSGDLRDSDYALASVPEVNALVSLPSPIPNEASRETSLSVAGPGASVVDIEEVVRLGAAPGFVEFDDGPAAVAATITSDFSLAGDHCVRSVDKVWYLPGGTTREGRRLTLRLFNPFSELAKATVSGLSEFGLAPLTDLSPVDIPGRSWRDLELEPSVPFLDDLVLVVSTEQGSVIPALSLVVEGGDEATWPGDGLSTTWEFPLVTADGLVPSLVMSNPGAIPATVDIDVFSSTAATPSAVTVEVTSDVPTRIDLSDIGLGTFGIRVRSTSPISAVVVSEDPPPQTIEGEEPEEPIVGTRVAATTGAREQASRWLLPGAGSVPDARSALWIMNSNPEAVTVTVVPLGSTALVGDKIQIEPGRVVRYEVPGDLSIGGYLVDASVPVTAAWSAEADRGVVFVGGIAIGE